MLGRSFAPNLPVTLRAEVLLPVQAVGQLQAAGLGQGSRLVVSKSSHLMHG